MNIQILKDVATFLTTLPREDRAKIEAHIHALATDQTDGLTIKTLKGVIKELIVKQHRLIFFRIDSMGYIVDMFKKQNQKTLKRIIERAEKIYKNINL